MSPKVATPTVEETLAFLAGRVRHLESLEHGIEPFSAHLNNPCARVYRSTNQLIGNLAWTAISFSNERFDTDNIWVIGTPTNLTCRTAGKYVISGTMVFAANNAGSRMIRVFLNNATQIASTGTGALQGLLTYLNIATVYDLGVGDFVELSVFQNSGGNLNCGSYGNYSPEFMMARVG